MPFISKDHFRVKVSFLQQIYSPVKHDVECDECYDIHIFTYSYIIGLTSQNLYHWMLVYSANIICLYLLRLCWNKVCMYPPSIQLCGKKEKISRIQVQYPRQQRKRVRGYFFNQGFRNEIGKYSSFSLSHCSLFVHLLHPTSYTLTVVCFSLRALLTLHVFPHWSPL